MDNGYIIKEIYEKLNGCFGALGWWPAESMFEVMVGAVLTQNTNWVNVEKAILSIKNYELMSPDKLLKEKNLPEIIKSAGCYRLKSKRLKALCEYLVEKHDKNYENLKKKSFKILRTELLSVDGVGPETADCIILYALGKPVFVVDNYTRRIMSRHGIIGISDPYASIQEQLKNNFSNSVSKLKQYHAMLVETGKRFCRKKNPLCGKCPLKPLLFVERKKNE